MKKFKFTLQTVHNVREMRQEKEELVFAQLQAEVNQAAERLVNIEQTYISAINNYTHKLRAGEPVNVNEMALDSNHIVSLERMKREVAAELERKKQACNTQSHKVAAAVREVKITNRLRETQITRHRLELDRHEQNNLDEIVSANYARRMTNAK